MALIKDDEKMIQDTLDEIAKLCKSKVEEAKNDLKTWGEILLKIKKARWEEKNPQKVRDLLIAEEHSWVAVQAIKTKYGVIIEDTAWKVIEKLLTLLRNIFIGTIIKAV